MYSATRAIEAERAGRPLFVFCSRKCNQLYVAIQGEKEKIRCLNETRSNAS